MAESNENFESIEDATKAVIRRMLDREADVILNAIVEDCYEASKCYMEGGLRGRPSDHLHLIATKNRIADFINPMQEAPSLTETDHE